MLGKIFKYVLVILLGMILGVGATVGAVYLIVTKTKVGTITEKVPSLNQYIGESLGDYTVLEIVEVLGAPDTTIGTYTEYFPFLDDALTGLVDSEELKQFATFDLDKLKTMTFSQVGSDLASVVSVTASLDSLSSSMNFTLPDMPVFTSAENYVKITNDQFVVTNLYYKDKTAEIYYDVSYTAPDPDVPEGGAETPAETGAGEPVYARAYDDEGNLLAAAEGKPLYYRAEGITSLPVTDAVTALSGVFSDVDSMTIGDLDENFGIDVIGEDPDSLIAKLLSPSDEISDLGVVEERIDALRLVEDLGFTNIEGTVLGEILPNEEDRTVGALKTMPVDERIENLRIDQIIDVTEDSSLIMKALADTTVGGLDAKIKTLTVSDVTEITEDSSAIMKSLADTTIEDLDAKIKTLTVSDVTEITENSSPIMKALAGIAIEELDARIKTLTVGEVVEIDETSEPILRALQNAEITSLNDSIKNLTVADVMSAEQIENNKILKWLSDKNAKIAAIGDEINAMPLDVLVEKGTNPITDALIEKEATVVNLGEVINTLTVSEIYDTGAFVKIGGGEGETPYDETMRCFEFTDGVYRETAYAADKELYQIKKTSGIWLITLYDKAEGGAAYTPVADEPALVDLADYLPARLMGETTGLGACSLQELYEVGFISAQPDESVRDLALNDVVSRFGQAGIAENAA